MNPHQGHRERKKQQFRDFGLDAFADHEVLELLLFYAIPRQDTNPLAHELLHRFGSLEAVLEASLEADESLQDIAVAGGVHYFIMSNMDAVSLTWVDGTACVTISGDLDDTETEAIIHSIKSGGN